MSADHRVNPAPEAGSAGGPVRAEGCFTYELRIFDQQLRRAHGVNTAVFLVAQVPVQLLQHVHEVLAAQHGGHRVAE